ncbi:MAG: hypothetical protein HG423_010505 [Propionibacterium sp.]|jgi:hypothetical protein|nr:hypothetical protein [Propionibacterium sp.]
MDPTYTFSKVNRHNLISHLARTQQDHDTRTRQGDHRSTWQAVPNFWSEFELALAKVWSGYGFPF